MPTSPMPMLGHSEGNEKAMALAWTVRRLGPGPSSIADERVSLDHLLELWEQHSVMYM